jgi:hypothetical protein
MQVHRGQIMMYSENSLDLRTVSRQSYQIGLLPLQMLCMQEITALNFG